MLANDILCSLDDQYFGSPSLHVSPEFYDEVKDNYSNTHDTSNLECHNQKQKQCVTHGCGLICGHDPIYFSNSLILFP
jgi:hypothetical protein